MVFDLEESVSLHGDSGPYVLYAYARTQSLLKNIKNEPKTEVKNIELTPEEREVLRFLEQFNFITLQSAQGLAVNNLTEYLVKLSKSFNHFYETHPILGSKQEKFRVDLTK